MRKSNQILLGIILLLIGIMSLGASYFEFNYVSLTFFIGGLACLLLYRTKRKSWSLVVGVYAVYSGLTGFMTEFFDLSALYPAMFFISPGIIFLVLYFDKNKRGLLLPGSVLVWFGLNFILKSTPLGNFINSFMFCMGASLLSAYFAGKGCIGKWSLYLGSILGMLSIISIINIPFSSLPISAPAAIIICGLIIIVGAVHNRKN